MKLSKLLGLFFVSLLLAACWLSTVPCAEDPWDENKVVVADSGSALGDGAPPPPADDGGLGIVIVPGAPVYSKIFNLHIVVLSGTRSDLKAEARRSSNVEVIKLGITKPEHDPVKTRK
jgi:hypothetical protein